MHVQPRHWHWEEAFDKFGFGDGDGEVFTAAVAAELATLGFTCTLHEFSLHNTIIRSISIDGDELIQQDSVAAGYDNPRDYLPATIVSALDAAFPSR